MTNAKRRAGAPTSVGRQGTVARITVRLGSEHLKKLDILKENRGLATRVDVVRDLIERSRP